MTCYCHHCMTQCAVTERAFPAAVLMRCQGCGQWIKCPRCMSIRSVEHTCAYQTLGIPS